MRLVVLVLVASVLLPASLLAGCVDCLAGPPVTARGIGASTSSTSGLVGFSLTVRVTDEPDGPVLPGAGVVIYWGNDDVANWKGGSGSVLVDGRGERVVVIADPGAMPTTVASTSSDRLRTDTNGEVRAHLPSNRVVGIVVAAEGFTEEWIPAFAAGGLSDSDAIVVPLYHADVRAGMNGTWGPGAASTGAVTQNNYAWKPAELPFGKTDAARKGYAERLATLDAKLEWTNGPTTYGDLAIGIGARSDQPSYVSDDTQQLTPGAQTEEMRRGASELRHDGVLAAPQIYLGPATRTGYVAPLGMPYTIALVAHFDTAAARAAACASASGDGGSGLPGAHVPLDAALPFAALLVAFVLARRGQRPLTPK